MKEGDSYERYMELAEKWLNGSITPAEQEEYARWYNAFQQGEGLQVPADRAKDMEAHRKKILREINKKRGLASPVVRVLRYGAAAAVFLVLLGTGYFYLHEANKKRGDVVVAKTNGRHGEDLDPGIAGAVLTLANGRKIVLDTAANGNVAENGQASVVKKDGSILFFASAESTEPGYNTLVTPKGRQEQLVLADGTKIWLNAGSSIKFPAAFIHQQRQVEMTGEAYFEVARNPAKPFLVNVHNASVEVLGTHFNVSAYSNDPALVTTLLEGSVKFRNRSQELVLKPGQQSRLLEDDELNLVPDADVELAMAWRNGMQAFKEADIRTIMRQVERWYDVEVEFKGSIPERTFSGEIPRTVKLSELLKLLETVSRMHFLMDANKRKITITA